MIFFSGSIRLENNENELVLFESQDKSIKLSVPFNNETVWLSQRQMIELFERDQSVISKHIKNVFAEKELEQESNMQILHIANSDKTVVIYSLDVLSGGVTDSQESITETYYGIVPALVISFQ